MREYLISYAMELRNGLIGFGQTSILSKGTPSGIDLSRVGEKIESGEDVVHVAILGVVKLGKSKEAEDGR
jgi:hypothetical protein